MLCSATDSTTEAPGGGGTSTTDEPLWQRIMDNVTAFVDAATPIADMVAAADPALAPAIAIGEKLLQGVIAEEPTAVNFWKQFQSGTPPTQAQLTQWAADYDASYSKLKADIATQLAALPPGA